MQTILSTQASPEVVINENFDALSDLAVYARKASGSTGLTWTYYGGRWFGFSVSDGFLTLTASATNYIVAARATGALSVATTTTNWNDIINYEKVYQVVTGTASVTSYTSYRAGGVIGGPVPVTTLSGVTLNDGYTEEVFAAGGTGPAISPSNGSIQTWTLSGNSTPTAGTWNNGQSIMMMIDDGTAYTVTWTSLPVTWKTNAGAAPALNTSGYTAIQLWKVGGTIYGARIGDA